jgi:hypothetical protein
MSDDTLWTNLKTRVITRAFYEDAYLDFFIQYYTALGFDNIVILKADTDRFQDYKPPRPDGILTATGGCTSRIDIIPVENEGNNILKTHYSYYADKEYDWILNIDTDEFLVIDLEKYPGGIKEYIYRLTHSLTDARVIPSADACQQIKFRWMCINKLNNEWPVQITPELIVNPMIKLPSTALTPENPHPKSLAGYFMTHPLEIYKFVKSMCNTKWANPEPLINAHFFYPISCRSRNFNVLDGDLRGINDSDPRHYPRDRSMLKNGYILHINTRSLANSITKCLTTKLRDNKKIKDPDMFRQIVNSYSPASIITPDARQKLKREFADQLNSKSFFPQKIHRFNSLVARFINPDYIYKPLTNMITGNTGLENQCSGNDKGGQAGAQLAEPDENLGTHIQQGLAKLVMTTPIVNEELEWQILRDLCLANDINHENMRQIINLF